MSYVPNQGDIITMDFSPTLGHEQKGRRPALVVSNNTFNNFAKGTALVCPITNTDKCIPIHVKLSSGLKTSGVVLTEQIKALYLSKRNVIFVENISDDLLFEVCDIVTGFVEIEDKD